MDNKNANDIWSTKYNKMFTKVYVDVSNIIGQKKYTQGERYFEFQSEADCTAPLRIPGFTAHIRPETEHCISDMWRLSVIY